MDVLRLLHSQFLLYSLFSNGWADKASGQITE